LNESGLWRSPKTGVSEVTLHHVHRHVKGLVRKPRVADGAVLVYLPRIDQNETSRWRQLASPRPPQTLNPLNHDRDHVFFVEVPRKGVAPKTRVRQFHPT
jgi:hypothetical protein